MEENQNLRMLFPTTNGMYIYDSHGYFLTSFVSEMNLNDALEIAEGSYPEDLAVFRAIELLRLVEVAHLANIIHGALSPSVLMLPLPKGLLASNLPAWNGEPSGGWECVAMVLSNFSNATDATLVSAEESDFSLDHRGIHNVLTRLIDRPEVKTGWVRPLWKDLITVLRSSSSRMNGEQSAQFLRELRLNLIAKVLPQSTRASSSISIEIQRLNLLKAQRYLAENPTITLTASFLPD